MAFDSNLDLNGEPPPLADLQCEACLAQGFIFKDKVVGTADVLHMRFAGVWHRLYFDLGIIFWRISDEDPRSWRRIESEDYTYPLSDIGKEQGLIGKHLEKYEMVSAQSEAKVTFVFKGGPTVVIENCEDITNLRVLSSD